MKLVDASSYNVDDLYDLAIDLSESEGQPELFSASREQYYNAFLSTSPSCFGVVAYQGESPVGLYAYFYKFASYLGARVMYIEDLHLAEGADTVENKHILLQHATIKSKDENCCRIEMRVLKNFNFGYDVIEMSGFEKIQKWEVYRMSL